VSDDARDWRWADANGGQNAIAEAELKGSLSRGELPACTLVWRSGWGEWLPASQVGELRAALPPNEAEPSVAPRLDPRLKKPPPAPLHKYNTRLTKEAAAKLLAKARAGLRPAVTSVVPPRPSSVPPRPSSVPPWPSSVPPRPASVPPRPPSVASGQAPPNGEPRPSKGPPPFRGRAAMKSMRPAAQPLVPPKVPGGRGTPLPPPPPARPPVPTLIEMAPNPVAGTLRPPAAVPPPPRAVPTLRGIEPPAEPVAPPVQPAAPVAVKAPATPVAATLTTTPLAPTATATPLPTIVISDKPPPADPPVDAAPAAFIPEPPNPTPPPWDAEIPRVPTDKGLGPEAGRATSSTPPPSSVFPRPRRPNASVLTIGLSAAAAILIVTVVVLLVTRTPEEEAATAAAPEETAAPSATPSAAVSPPPPKPKPQTKPEAAPCTLGMNPKRIFERIVQGVPPYTSRVPSSPRIALGLATTSTHAAGVTLDPATLDVARTFNQVGTTPIVGVVPVIAPGRLSFAVDRENAPLKFARTIDARPPFSVGMVDEGFARQSGKDKPEVVWPGDGAEKITEIRVASVEAIGHAVTFRRGGQSGKVLAGWLMPDGVKKSELVPLETTDPFVGTPSVAANDSAIVVSYATRASADGKWQVELAAAPHGELPSKPRRLAIPAGGPGGEAISPAAVGLTKGRWFVQWTEGTSGQRQVRGQALDRDLSPIGEAVTLSPPAQNSGQGTLFMQGDQVIALFLVSTGKAHELWGASLSCR
jgi:hypothetical protein